MENIDDLELYTNSKELPKEYLLLKYRLALNDYLYEENIIDLEIFNKMQDLIIDKMNKIIEKCRND